jgi:hypothetical protein
MESEYLMRSSLHMRDNNSVPYSKSGIVPRSSLLGAGQLGLGNLERVG